MILQYHTIMVGSGILAISIIGENMSLCVNKSDILGKT